MTARLAQFTGKELRAARPSLWERIECADALAKKSEEPHAFSSLLELPAAGLRPPAASSNKRLKNKLRNQRRAESAFAGRNRDRDYVTLPDEGQILPPFRQSIQQLFALLFAFQLH
ncbi:hypothetical protein NE237_016364 [Protea cynaroides]|uniref:Uncharacterized protein n=1 Tax=Protea cynaroides TaxID=273540 RepID=A0A9Q0JRT0_9MAGN|nr:hypothetical protein NE237_016364 [Protea cynaroides]